MCIRELGYKQSEKSLTPFYSLPDHSGDVAVRAIFPSKDLDASYSILFLYFSFDHARLSATNSSFSQTRLHFIQDVTQMMSRSGGPGAATPHTAVTAPSVLGMWRGQFHGPRGTLDDLQRPQHRPHG
ncbi:hypothetical protein RRG08_039212 [Elysia crispata]|uniref:Uncharacterized protein n=1 Tax=Elysia crispata TaxID=231223 RepID=A0AAE1AU30_9GAST|nr:hypothetical protein RRG08_039212 [Elysia crispata]